jgi:hypothetical protein
MGRGTSRATSIKLEAVADKQVVVVVAVGLVSADAAGTLQDDGGDKNPPILLGTAFSSPLARLRLKDAVPRCSGPSNKDPERCSCLCGWNDQQAQEEQSIQSQHIDNHTTTSRPRP